MKEILTCGDCLVEFKRLGINPQETWKGHGWNKDGIITIYEVTEDEFKTLCNDEDSENTWQDSCWRWSEGSVLGSPDKRFIVNNHYLLGWSKEQYSNYEYKHLLEYLCDEIGASTERNITACAIDLAKYNNMTLAKLFKKYQGEYLEIKI